MKIRVWMLAMLALIPCLTACAQETPPGDTPATSAPTETATQEETTAMTDAATERVPIPADTALYRGTVQSLSPGEGETLVELEQVKGTNFGAPSVTVALTADTLCDFNPAELAEGDYLEIAYGGWVGDGLEQVTAVTAARLAPADLSVYNGTLQEIRPPKDGEDGTMLLTALEGTGDILFHLGGETQLYLDVDSLQAGDQINVYFSGATTRSIPPQATALEVRRYAE